MTAVAESTVPVEDPGVRSRFAARVVYSAPELIASALAGFGAPTVVLLLAGHFSRGWVLPLGVAGAAVAVAVCGVGREQVDRRAVQYTLVAIALALAWLITNSFFSAENLFAHRDPSTYDLAGRWLMDHARMPIPTDPQVFGSPTGGAGSSAGFGEIPGSTDLYAQGNHLLPALLAVVGWLFGPTAMLKANVVFGALALLVFFGLARRVVGGAVALVAMAALAVSMPLVFVSRDTYSEPLALLFLVGGLALLHRAVESGRVRDFALAGFVFAMSAPARIDSNVSLLALMVTAAVFPIFAARATRRIATIRSCALVGGAALPTLLGWLDVTWLSFGYYRDERHHIIPIFYTGYVLLAVLPLVVVVSWSPRVRRLLRSPKLPLRATVVVGVLMAGAFVYLASRPLWMVAHGRYNATVSGIQRQAVQMVEPDRTYDEQTVHWLAQYLGWPTIVLAVVGYFLLVRRSIRSRSLASVGMIIVGLVLSLLYLWTPQITPDQPWAMRRFVPVVLPILIIAATYSISVLLRKSAAVIRAGALALAVVIVAVPAIVTAPMAGAREEVPQLAQVQRICAAVGHNGAVLEVDAPAQTSYSQTIRSYCNVPSYALIPAQPAQLVPVRDAVAANHRVLYLLATDPAAIQFVGGTPPAPFSIVNTTRWPSVLNAPPRHVDRELVAVYLATVGEDGLARPVTPR